RLGFVILLDNKRSPVRTKPQKSRKTDGIPTIRFAGAAHLQANETAPFFAVIRIKRGGIEKERDDLRFHSRKPSFLQTALLMLENNDDVVSERVSDRYV
ncbi:MAG: hypothetical protein IJU52_00285, partial [Clostridia bacterium]|nr:hypothetical protein [Clostridia bacterium]